MFGGLVAWVKLGLGLKAMGEAVKKEEKLANYDWKISAKKVVITLGKVAIGGAAAALLGIAADPVAARAFLDGVGIPPAVAGSLMVVITMGVTFYNNWRKNRSK